MDEVERKKPSGFYQPHPIKLKRTFYKIKNMWIRMLDSIKNDKIYQ